MSINKIASILSIAVVIASFATWLIGSLDTRILLTAAIWILIFEIILVTMGFLNFAKKIDEDITDLEELIKYFVDLSGKFLNFYDRVVEKCVKANSSSEKCPPEIMEEYRTLKTRLEEFNKYLSDSPAVVKYRSRQLGKFMKK